MLVWFKALMARFHEAILPANPPVVKWDQNYKYSTYTNPDDEKRR
jgi:hypothetical protein